MTESENENDQNDLDHFDHILMSGLIWWKMIFFEKKSEKVLVVQKKVVPLHPQSREMHFRTEVECGNSSVGRAQPCQGWGRGSESRFPLTY